MNNDEIIDDSIFEDINDGIQSQSVEETNDEVSLAEKALLEELALDGENPEEETSSIEESVEEVVEDVEEITPHIEEEEFSLPELDDVEESTESTEEITLENVDEIEDDISNEEDNIVESEDIETLLDDEEALLEDQTTEDLSLAENIEEEIVPEVQEEITSELEEEEISTSVISEDEVSIETDFDEKLISNDLNNIKIEFGIEAKGFILSVKMMEAMIEKGYIFKDILNDKTFDAVMIFNDNLENTVMTSDIKIKIEDGNIQLIKN